MKKHQMARGNTVDGSEIRRSPVDRYIYPISFKVSKTSQVVQDFFHQQYYHVIPSFQMVV